MKKKIIIGLSVVIVLLLIGVAYAWFNYRGEGLNNELIAGDIYMNFGVTGNGINLNPIFPETKEEARSRNDNYLTFTVDGINTTGKNIYYEILLNEGENVTGKERFRPDELVFDLLEVNGNTETMLLDAVSFNDFNNHKIWVDTILKETTTQITKTYKLRMWLSDKVIIGNDGGATYNQDDFANYYANIRVGAYGDLNEKAFPLTYEFDEEVNEFTLSLSNGYLDNEVGEETSDTMELKITSPDSNVRFDLSYSVSDGDNLTDVSRENRTNIDEIISYTTNDTISLNLSISGASLNGSDIYFEVLKNGVVVEKFIKTVFKSNLDINIMNIFPTQITNNKSAVTSVVFANVSEATLNSDYVPNGTTIFDLTYVDGNKKYGDVRGKLDSGVLTIASVGKTYLRTGYYLLSNYSNLTSIDFSNVDTSLVTNMYYMFGGASSLTSLDLSKFDTSKVTRMSQMFSNCSSLSSINFGSHFDTSKVTEMAYMFRGSGFSTLNINFDTSRVQQMHYMFAGMTNLTSITFGNNFTTLNVKYMYYMFSGCTALTSLDLSGFVTPNLVNMGFMFQNCSALTSIDMSNFDTSKVTSFKYLFKGCSSLSMISSNTAGKADLTNFDTGQITNLTWMFHSCSSITDIEFSSTGMPNLEIMTGVFQGCTGLITLDLSGFNTANVTNMTNLFYGCTNLKTIYVSEDLWSINSENAGTNMFNNCRKINEDDPNRTHYINSSVTYARIDNPPDNPGYLTDIRDKPSA